MSTLPGIETDEKLFKDNTRVYVTNAYWSEEIGVFCSYEYLPDLMKRYYGNKKNGRNWLRQCLRGRLDPDAIDRLENVVQDLPRVSCTSEESHTQTNVPLRLSCFEMVVQCAVIGPRSRRSDVHDKRTSRRKVSSCCASFPLYYMCIACRQDGISWRTHIVARQLKVYTHR